MRVICIGARASDVARPFNAFMTRILDLSARLRLNCFVRRTKSDGDRVRVRGVRAHDGKITRASVERLEQRIEKVYIIRSNAMRARVIRRYDTPCNFPRSRADWSNCREYYASRGHSSCSLQRLIERTTRVSPSLPLSISLFRARLHKDDIDVRAGEARGRADADTAPKGYVRANQRTRTDYRG